MTNVFVSTHPLVSDSLTHLRDKSTTTKEFRRAAETISTLLISEASTDLALSQKQITTPLQNTLGTVCKEDIVIATIFRAGLTMLPASLQIFPNTPVGFVGLERDEKTAKAIEYYWKMPKISKETTIFLLDPMLATGGSLLHVLRKLPAAKQIRLVTIISAPEGIAAIHKEFPAVKIYTGAIDEKLNSKKFIVPGLGDFGDRYFGTE